MKVEIRGEIFRVCQPRKPVPVFIRYGMFSNRERSWNHSTGEAERGLSVYPARFVDGAIELADEARECGCDEKRTQDVLSGRYCFPVTGKVVGVGSDGEPLLVGVRMLPFAVSLKCKRKGSK
ncbi:MAG: hypothetical protein KGL39_45675 [Patescibacteria group bacterium]|nr:hypothetical protein [Patescibacteria group bacterium]